MKIRSLLFGSRSVKKIHLVCSPDLSMLLSYFLENEGFAVTGNHHSYADFLTDLKSREIDGSSIVFIEGSVGLQHPVQSSSILKHMADIRKYGKSLRIIVQLPDELQQEIEFIRQMVHLRIHDLQFFTSYQGDDILNWIREKKTTRDYYAVIGKPKRGLFGWLSGKKANIDSITVEAAFPEQETSLKKDEAVHPSLKVRPVLGELSSEEMKRITSAEEEAAPVLDHTSPFFKEAPLAGMPLVISICGARGDEDVGAAAFLLAAGLAKLGWKPLVCGDDRQEISSLEELAFQGEREDRSSKMFEYEGITFYRREHRWDISELMLSGYSHIILWIDMFKERPGLNGLELWLNAQVPIVVGHGAMWKYELLKERLSMYSPYERRRCRLLLESGQQLVLQRLKQDFDDLRTYLIPGYEDPLYPDETAVDWVSKLLVVTKKPIKKTIMLWGAVGAVFLLTLILISLGLSFSPESAG
ncbi:hypothetical protein [Paenibacillus turpanensis]|uniref:hypothetical protein n=1 Tax=Paenibacillus turpanensis TaxID=2689078 RepID=UPI00140B169C|nr:hypothetical protein [Paenibacillus turpanensis]